jgi:hypothetical protein
MDRVLNSVSYNLFIYYLTSSNFLFLFPQIISSESSLLSLQEFSIESVPSDRFSSDPYLALSSHLYCMFLFLFGLFIFGYKIKIH